MTKIIVIGLDAACLNVITPWLHQGKLPYLQKFLTDGTYSELESTIPPMTSSAWTSMVTGKNPGKHGVFDFFKHKPNSYDKEVASSLDNKSKCIWDYLTDHNKTSIVINVPLTYPPKNIKGILIPGYPAPEELKCFPLEILHEFEELHGKYDFSPHYAKNAPPEQKLQGAIDVTRIGKEAAVHYGQRYPWDFLMVQFQMTDVIIHQFELGENSLRLYQYVDRCVEEIVEALGKDANVFIVSDHGIGQARWHLFLNSWLRDNSLLKAKNVGIRYHNPTEISRGINPGKLPKLIDHILGFLAKRGITVEEYYRFLSKLRLTFLKDMVPKIVLSRIPRKMIDWENTRAFCPSSTIFGIRVNLKGREPRGTVYPGQEYDALRDQLIKQLRQLRSPDSELVFEKVLLREEYYQGNEVDQAPDIIFLPDRMDCVPSDVLMSRVFVPYTWCNHKLDGLLIAFGPDLNNAGYLSPKFNILDVAPTILHMCGLPIPEDMDGRVLTEIIRENSEPGQREIISQKVDNEADRVRSKIRGLKALGKL